MYKLRLIIIVIIVTLSCTHDMTYKHSEWYVNSSIVDIRMAYIA